jgi:hypothetical protein
MALPKHGETQELNELCQGTKYAIGQAIIKGVRANNLAIVRNSLTVGANVDIVDSLGYTALHWAAKRNYSEMAKWLVDYGANVNIQAKDGCTPLIVAASMNSIAVVKILLATVGTIAMQSPRYSRSVVNCNLQSRVGFSAAHAAVRYGSTAKR